MSPNNVTCIVLGGSTNALGQIRTVRNAGYNCINVVEKGMHSWSRKSNLCKGYLAPHPYNERKECVDFLIKIIKDLPSKPFLFFASDDWMDMVGENEAVFDNIAYIPQSKWEEMAQLYNKKFLYQIAEKYGIPYPKTIEVESLKDVQSKLNDVMEPIIVKPQATTSQNLIAQCGIHTFHRTQKFNTKTDFLNWVDILLKNNVDFPILIQEFIPGEATSLYTLTSYSNKDGELLAGSVGHKLRQFPPVAGRITSGVLQHNDELFSVGRKFLSVVKFYGLANTEFKYDARDGKYKLMEINTRLGAWNYSVLYSGLNLIKIAVDDTKGINYTGPSHVNDKDGKVWYNMAIDLVSSIYMNGKLDDKQYKITLSEWRKSLKGRSFEAIWSYKDPLPFIFNLWYLLKKTILG